MGVDQVKWSDKQKSTWKKVKVLSKGDCCIEQYKKWIEKAIKNWKVLNWWEREWYYLSK